MNALDINLWQQQMRKRKESRWGLSLIYGLPMGGPMAALIMNIQSKLEQLCPSAYKWYSLQRLHTTLVRSKSIGHQLSPISRNVIEDLLSKLNQWPIHYLEGRCPHIFPDGCIRLSLARLGPQVDGQLWKQFSQRLGIELHEVQAPWSTIGYLSGRGCQASDVNEVWQSTANALAGIHYRNKVLLSVESAKLIHYSNIEFTPIEDQHWIEVPLGAKPMGEINPDTLKLQLTN